MKEYGNAAWTRDTICWKSGYLVTLVTDACATYSQERHDTSLSHIKGYWRQRTTEQFMRELASVWSWSTGVFTVNIHFEALEPYFQVPKCLCKAPAILLESVGRWFESYRAYQLKSRGYPNSGCPFLSKPEKASNLRESNYTTSTTGLWTLCTNVPAFPIENHSITC